MKRSDRIGTAQPRRPPAELGGQVAEGPVDPEVGEVVGRDRDRGRTGPGGRCCPGSGRWCRPPAGRTTGRPGPAAVATRATSAGQPPSGPVLGHQQPHHRPHRDGHHRQGVAHVGLDQEGPDEGHAHQPPPVPGADHPGLQEQQGEEREGEVGVPQLLEDPRTGGPVGQGDHGQPRDHPPQAPRLPRQAGGPDHGQRPAAGRCRPGRPRPAGGPAPRTGPAGSTWWARGGSSRTGCRAR